MILSEKQQLFLGQESSRRVDKIFHNNNDSPKKLF
jgi:hypothetical protein